MDPASVYRVGAVRAERCSGLVPLDARDLAARPSRDTCELRLGQPLSLPLCPGAVSRDACDRFGLILQAHSFNLVFNTRRYRAGARPDHSALRAVGKSDRSPGFRGTRHPSGAPHVSQAVFLLFRREMSRLSRAVFPARGRCARWRGSWSTDPPSSVPLIGSPRAVAVRPRFRSVIGPGFPRPGRPIAAPRVPRFRIRPVSPFEGGRAGVAHWRPPRRGVTRTSPGLFERPLDFE